MKMKYLALAVFMIAALSVFVVLEDSDDSDADTYTVYFTAGSGGTVSIPSKSVTNTYSEFSCTATPNTNHTFSGWYYNNSLASTANPLEGVVADYNGITFEARFSYDPPAPTQYTCYLYYNANGGSGAPSTQSYTSTSTSSHTFTISNTTPTRSGYEFLGWSESSSASTASYSPGGSISVSYNGSKTLYAVWGETHTFSVTYSMNGGSPTISTQTWTGTGSSHTFTISSTVPTKSGYIFLGWDTQYTATTAQYQPGDPITVSAMADDYSKPLYAVWQQTHDFTVTYNMNGGTPQIATQTYTGTESSHTFTISSTVPTRSGYVFQGWDTQYTATTAQYQPGDSITVSAMADDYSKPLYAVWLQAHDFTVTYTMNGGTPQIATQTYTGTESSHTFTISDTVPTKSGYIFLGWDTQYTATSAVYQPGDSISVSAVADDYSKPLYAVWVYPYVYWTNGTDNEPMYNGLIKMVYQFAASSNKTHIMDIDLKSASVQNSVTTWSDSGYSLHIELSYSPLRVVSTLYHNGVAVAAPTTVSLGNWSTFEIQMDSQNGAITVIPVKVFNSFTDYSLYDNQARKVFDFSNTIKDTSMTVIEHSESGNGANSPKFSVTSTSVFLDTYGVVLYNPTINLHDYFPQYDSIRVNFYSFALYGESITINNTTYVLDGSKVTVQYVTDGKNNYLPGVMPNATTQTKTMDLTNIYVTFDGTSGHVLLTFVNDRFTIDLGAYQSGNWTVSMVGIWYFTSMVYSPYTAYEKSLSDWKMLPETSSAQMLLIFLGILAVAGVAVAIHAKRNNGLGAVDVVIILAAAAVAYILLG